MINIINAVTPKFYIGVACKEHVARGVEQGVCQFCHGKAAPVKRLNKDDYIIYYSSKISMVDIDAKPYQKFTAIGRITDSEPYKFDMGDGFIPYRRNVHYFKTEKNTEPEHVSIQSIISILPFIKNKTAWGYVFRYGFLEIDRESFGIIAMKMLGFDPIDK